MKTYSNSTISKDELEFAIFCIENVAERLDIDASVIYELLTKDSDLLMSYIIKCYEPLHTQDKEYIVNEIIELMWQRGLLG